MFTVTFWKSAAERALKTAAQTLLLAAGAGAGFNLFAFDWKSAAGAVLGGAVLSLLTSIGSAPFGPAGSPSLVPDSTTPNPASAIGSDQAAKV